MRRRERHDRGLRGPLAAPNPITGKPVTMLQARRGADLFAELLRASLEQVARHCPRALAGLDVGYEEVPGNLDSWQPSRVPLAVAIPAQSGRNGQIVLFRRPLEHRAASRPDLRRIIHQTLLEQLSALTGIDIDQLDPNAGDPDRPD